MAGTPRRALPWAPMGIYVSYADLFTVVVACTVFPAIYYGAAYLIAWLIRLVRRSP